MSDANHVPAAPGAVTDRTAEQSSNTPWWVPSTRAFLAMWMSASSFAIVVLVWWKPPPADSQLLNILIGMYVGTGFITVLNWWVGSSKGSDDKTGAITQMASSAAASSPTKPTGAQP